MDKELLKQQVCATIDEHGDELIAIGKKIFENPELGYKEFETAKVVQAAFDRLGLAHQDNLAITGVKAKAEGKKHNKNVAILGELDSVLCHGHPFANKLTGAAHACGHNAQITTMLGAAFGLVLSGAINELDGDVSFMAVPAEEFVELEYRETLRKEGKIDFFGGKQEMLKVGAFDDVDMAMMCHSASTPDPNMIALAGANGFVGKLINFKGKDAHAGGAPHLGINALNAATLGLMAIHAQRETFQDKDSIRVHPIITKGGDLVNIVPSDVRMETYVRGAEVDAIVDASKKVNRALVGSAMSVGATVEITEIPGYLPLRNNEEFADVILDNLRGIVKPEHIIRMPGGGGSTDMGDICAVMPGVHLAMGGFSGGAHQPDFVISDDEAAYISPAKIMACTVIDLLADDAQKATEICNNYKPKFTKEGYVQFWSDFVKA